MRPLPIRWEVSTSSGQAEAFHNRVPAETSAGNGVAHQLWIHHLPAPALVLGSTQPDELVRRARAETDGIEVCRRRSGGGLVFINPETDCWIDAIVPRSSPIWDDDVGRAFHWLGELWAKVLTEIDTDLRADVSVARSSTTSELGRVWCFADLGHGEVSLYGSKVVGLSQRRTRNWARFQGLLLGAWPGDQLLPYVDLERLVADDPRRYLDAELLRPGLVQAGFPAQVPSPNPVLVAERFAAAIESSTRDESSTQDEV